MDKVYLVVLTMQADGITVPQGAFTCDGYSLKENLQLHSDSGFDCSVFDWDGQATYELDDEQLERLLQ